jgi:hypothetical protein
MQIVISQSDGRRIAQGANSAQHSQRIRTPIDQVAYKPKSIAIRREVQGAEQGAEFSVAALHVADCVQRHQPPMG